MADITVGKPDVRCDTAAHGKGVRRGNHKGWFKHQPGHLRDDRSTARRSTGISAKHHEPMLADMPNLSPA